MGRPISDTAEYFSHYAEGGVMPVKVLERKFANDGYAVWYKLQEILGRTPGHYLDLRQWDSYEAYLCDFGVDDELLEAILTYLAESGWIDAELWAKRVVWMPSFIDGLAWLYKKRGREVPLQPDLDAGRERVIADTETPISGAEMPQRKVKGSKVKHKACSDRGSGGKVAGATSPARAKHEKMVDDYFGKLRAGDDAYDGFMRDYPTIDLDAELARARRWLKANMTRARRRGVDAADGLSVSWSEWLGDTWLDREEKRALKGSARVVLDGVPSLAEFKVAVRMYMGSDRSKKGAVDILGGSGSWMHKAFNVVFGGAEAFTATGVAYLDHALKRAYDEAVELTIKKRKKVV